MYYEIERKSIADYNVKMVSLNDNAVVYGDHGENYEHTNYSLVEGRAKLVQIDIKDNKSDTLFINSSKMEAFRSKPEYYIAEDSVKVIRSDFLSSSQVGYYFKDISGTGGVISLSINPAVWKEELQVTGDSIYAFFKEDIEEIYVNKSAFAIQPGVDYPDRFDQISGVFMYMKFKNNELDYIQVDTNAASVYFAYENNSPGGANRAKGEVIILYFKDKLVNKVKVIGKPKGTFYPENLIVPAELRLTGFRLRSDKPERE